MQRIAAIVILLSALAAAALAAVPGSISYQGYLKNGDGTPVNTQVPVTFSLYSSNPARNNPVWRETQNVTPANGIFGAKLGAVAPIALPFDVPYWLGVKVGSDPEMTPLQPLTSVAYAIRAGMVDSVGTASLADAGVTTAKLADGAVTDAKVSGPISAAKLDLSTVVKKAGDSMTGGLSITTASGVPLSASTSAPSPAITATTTGTSSAGSYQINNATSSASALFASTNGSGNAIAGMNFGTGNAGYFLISNTSSAFPALSASTNGTGNAGSFQINSTSNNTSALYASTSGPGNAGYFSASNASSNADALAAVNSGNGNAFSATTSGLGRAGSFQVNNAASSAYALYATTNGSGSAVSAANTGTGNAGTFTITNASNGNSALYVATSGTGNAGYFSISNASSNASAIYAFSNGTATAVNAYNSGTGYAGYFSGKVQVLGNLTVSGTINGAAKPFKIDHPLDPKNKYLYHTAIESPDMMNIYNGNVTTDAEGYATIELPDWFEALNRDYRYQLTVMGQFAQAIIDKKIANHRFTIRTDKPAVEVSWQVTGIRRDAWAEAHRIPVEEEKPAAEKGSCMHPEACAGK